MSTTAADSYIARFRKVLEFIDAHLDEGLRVDRLAGVDTFAKYHFYRQYSGLFGICIHRFVQLLRLNRATHQLTFRGDTAS